MPNTKNDMKQFQQSGRTASIVLFTLGFGLFLFTRRSEIVPTIPITIVIAPIIVLRFSRTLPAAKAIFYTLAGFILSMNISLWGLFDIRDQSLIIVFNVVRSTLLAVLYFLPYMIDRLVTPRFAANDFLSTLIFPAAVTGLFFLSSLEGPFDGTVAKTIYGHGPLIFQQLNSIVGLWGFIFLYSWLASILNHAWENGFEWRTTKWPASAFILLVALFALFGAYKMSPLAAPDRETVRIAAVVLIPQDGKPVSMDEIFETKPLSQTAETLSRIKTATRTAAENGARIVTFQEYAMTVDQAGEQMLRTEFRRIARENNILMSITFAVFAGEGKGKNKHLLIDESGAVRADYTKRYLLGFGDLGETGVFVKGPEIIQTVETQYGTIGLSICRDMNFQTYIRQAGQADVDIMLSPSYDFPKSTGPAYYQRAIENGFSLVRPTYNGISYAEDFNGRILASMDSDVTTDGIMYADVPTKGVRTVYTAIGDLLGWLSVLGTLGFIVTAVLFKCDRPADRLSRRRVSVRFGVCCIPGFCCH